MRPFAVKAGWRPGAAAAGWLALASLALLQGGLGRDRADEVGVACILGAVG
jgi:hypothetical protein